MARTAHQRVGFYAVPPGGVAQKVEDSNHIRTPSPSKGQQNLEDILHQRARRTTLTLISPTQLRKDGQKSIITQTGAISSPSFIRGVLFTHSFHQHQYFSNANLLLKDLFFSFFFQGLCKCLQMLRRFSEISNKWAPFQKK